MTDNETTAQRIAREFATYNLSMRKEIQAELAALIENHLDAEQAEPKPPTCPFCDAGEDEEIEVITQNHCHRAACMVCGVSLSGWCATRDEALALHEQRAAEWVEKQEKNPLADPRRWKWSGGTNAPPSTPPAEVLAPQLLDWRQGTEGRQRALRDQPSTPPAEEWEPPGAWDCIIRAARRDHYLAELGAIPEIERLLREGHAATLEVAALDREVSRLRTEVAELEQRHERLIAHCDAAAKLRGEKP